MVLYAVYKNHPKKIVVEQPMKSVEELTEPHVVIDILKPDKKAPTGDLDDGGGAAVAATAGGCNDHQKIYKLETVAPMSVVCAA